MRAFYHPSQAAHDPLQYMRVGRVIAPKDVPARTEALLGALQSLGITPQSPVADYPEARAAVHTKGFLQSSNTAIAAADAVSKGERLAYALCRPSGHHTRADRASGFCYVNNTAAVAERLRATFSRVAILDVDAHHGDGTQQIFNARPDVLTISIHADPRHYYPFFTGYSHEVGIGDGAGFNLNLPLAHGSAGAAMFTAVERAADRIREFGTDALVVALGFDAHARDPIGVLKLESHDFAGIGTRVRDLGLPTVVVQEGGYAVDAIGDCLTAFLDGARPAEARERLESEGG